MEVIRSRQNPLVKQLIKLAEKRRERANAQQSLLIGTHLVSAALAARWPLQRLLVCEGEDRRPEIASLLSQAPCPVLSLAPELFAEIEQTPSTSGLIALIPLPERPSLRQSGCCLLLESVQDPGNVGAILRTAAAAGVDQVWLTTGSADIWSPKVLRAGMGAHFLLQMIEHIDLDVALANFPGPVLVTALQDAHSLYESALPESLVLAFGSEGRGASPALLAHATARVSIPMAGPVESLNVAAAVAICLFERHRRRLSAG
ncbi:MAG: hypothetical protein K0Q68_2873 [Moraxellaceae bacterium]|jgi:TrmH family RNA methyltransferase|nr:hypothetical protein [Moraxellaceae bacterium]